MDVLIVRSSLYTLPSQQRVDAIVHDGSADLRLWPGRGPDSDLREVWGEGLQEALDTERQRLGGGPVPLYRPVRVQPGRLHCDFLVWVPTRPPEPGATREPAPDAQGVEQAVRAVLEFVADRDVGRVAFEALGAGLGELPVIDRLEHVVRASHRFFEERYREGRPAGVDQVLVCEPSGATVRELSRRVRSLVRETIDPQPTAPRPERAKSQARTGGGRRSPKRAKLGPDEVARAQSTAPRYDIHQTYVTGDWMLHPKFGAGRVEQVTPEGAIVVLFEDGEQRKMVHGR